MNIVAEISMYPLQSDYIPPIDDFLAQLNAEPSVEVKTNRMSTQLFGDHDVVMDLAWNNAATTAGGLATSGFPGRHGRTVIQWAEGS